MGAANGKRAKQGFGGEFALPVSGFPGQPGDGWGGEPAEDGVQTTVARLQTRDFLLLVTGGVLFLIAIWLSGEAIAAVRRYRREPKVDALEVQFE